jgi:phosphoglycolate phosphatase-like HAD superfamily hydrolase
MEANALYLVLFDIDGTLIATGGAGMRAFNRALRDVFHIDGAHSGFRPDGKTDPLIARELLSHFGLEGQWCDRVRETLFSAYLSHLEEEMQRAKDQGLIRVLPGVLELLERLDGRSDFSLGLVTGNLEEGARIKLEKAALNRYFRFGGYGSDSEDRTVLIRMAMERGNRAVSPTPPRATYVFGDTPLDIIHGHAAGAKVIGVASGRYTLNALRLHNPDLLLPDMVPSDAIIGFMARGAEVP